MRAFTPLEREKKAALRQAAWDKTGGRCWYCGCALILRDDEVPVALADGRPKLAAYMTIDHQDPMARRLNAPSFGDDAK